MAFIGYNSQKPIVLVVDDTPEIQRYLRILLELDSYRVETVGSGREALQCLHRVPAPEVVLLDVQMPEMDGLETLRRIQELRPKPKVIMCSGEDDPSKVQQALSLGARAYLLKPIRHLYLSAAIERCLEAPAPRPTEPLGAQMFVLPSQEPLSAITAIRRPQILSRTMPSRNSLS